MILSISENDCFLPVMRVRMLLDVRHKVFSFTEATPATTLTSMLHTSLPAVLLCRSEAAIAELRLALVTALAHVVAVMTVVMGLGKSTRWVRTFLRRRLGVGPRRFLWVKLRNWLQISLCCCCGCYRGTQSFQFQDFSYFKISLPVSIRWIYGAFFAIRRFFIFAPSL